MIGTSRRGTSSRMAQLVLFTSAFGLIASVQAASLKDKPARGVTLAGTEWRIDPYRSDDPEEVIEKAQQAKVREEQHRVSRRVGGMDRGDSSGPWGGGEDNHGTWGGHTGMPRPPSDLPGGSTSRDPTDLPSDRGGGYGQHTDRTSTDIDPTGSSASIQIGSTGGGIRNDFVGQLAKNPDTLSFREVNEHVAVAADKLETECAAGKKEPISDSYGDGERNCGWDGRAWVVETTRGKHFSRTDRYELSKDGKRLDYVTTASGAGMPKVKIYRVYTLAPARASN